MYLLFSFKHNINQYCYKKKTYYYLVISKIKQMQETENYAPMNEERKTLTIDK